MDKLFNSTHIVNLIFKWKFHLLLIVVISAILGGVFSGPRFITPLYKSNAIVYPANIEPYSEESQTEQMLQTLNSQDIIDSVIAKFNLAKHYGINPNYKYFKTALYNQYHDYIRIKKTPYESADIEVLDKSPDTAAMIVNSIIDLFDKKMASMHKKKFKEVEMMYKLQLSKKRAHIDSLKQIMYILGTEQGIFEYENQSREIMKGYLSGSSSSSKEAKRLMKNMEKASGQLVEVVEMIQQEAAAYVMIKLDYEMAVRFLDSELTYTNIISYPYVSDKKSYPIRWLVVVLVTLTSFIMSLLVIFLIESKKKKS